MVLVVALIQALVAVAVMVACSVVSQSFHMVVVSCQTVSVRHTMVLQLRMAAAVAVMVAYSQSSYMVSTCQVVVSSSHMVAVVRSIKSSSHMVVVSSNSWRVQPAEVVGVASVDTQEAEHPQEKGGVMAVEEWGIW